MILARYDYKNVKMLACKQLKDD